MESQGQDQGKTGKNLILLCECDGWCIERVEISPADYNSVKDHANWFIRSPNCANNRGKVVEVYPNFIVYQHPWRVNPLGLPHIAKKTRAYNDVIFREFQERQKYEDTHGTQTEAE